MPHFDRPLAILDCPPDRPIIALLNFVSRRAKLSNFALSPMCCHENQMLVRAASALNLSPPLRPAEPSSLYSPYIGAVPYIGARPYVVAGFSVVEIVVAVVSVCAMVLPIEPANARNADCVIVC